jgi:hypothetical protein
MKLLLAIALLAAPAAAQTFKFDNVMYHAEVFEASLSPFANRGTLRVFVR